MDNYAGTITRRTLKATDDLFDSLKHMYSKTDFRRALNALFHNSEAVYNCVNKLCQLLIKAGISFDKIQPPEEYITLLKENAPELMTNFMTYLKDAEMVLSNLDRTYQPAQTAEFAKLKMMFKSLDINIEANRDLRYYYTLIEKAPLAEDEEYQNKILDALFENYQSYPSPEMFMNRLVTNLAHEKNRNKKESVRLRILKQFVLETDCLNGWYKGKKPVEDYAKAKLGVKKLTPELTASALDDEIFTVTEKKIEDEIAEVEKAYDGKPPANKKESDSRKEKKKSIKDKYELLKICEDLAQGRFKVQFGTKKALYLFAVAFNMTYYSGEPDEIFDPVTDIEKNLFNDYYTNSFFRFLGADYKDSEKKAGLDCEAGGEGINYKNYAEMIFIYCISQDIPAIEKLEMAKRLMNAVKGSSPTHSDDNSTKHYRQLFTGEIIKMNEKDFENFIKENYDCSNKGGSPFALCSSKNSAFEQYTKLMNELSEEIDNENLNSTKMMNRLASINDYNDTTKSRLLKNCNKYFDKLKNICKSEYTTANDSRKQVLDEYLSVIKKQSSNTMEKLNAAIGYNIPEITAEIFKSISDFYGSKTSTFEETEEKVCTLLTCFWEDNMSFAENVMKRAAANIKPHIKEQQEIRELLTAKAIKDIIFKNISTDVKDMVRTEIEIFNEERISMGRIITDKITLDCCKMGLWFLEALDMDSCKKRSRSAAWKEYIELLSAINNFICCKESTGNMLKIFKRSKDTVNRAFMITVFYYKYIIREEAAGITGSRGISFEDIFAEFKEEIDEYLIRSYYPEFSGKNIFDVCIALSAYSYITQ